VSATLELSTPSSAARSAAAAEFHRFYETWMPRVYAFARVRLGDARGAEEVARAVLEAAIASPLGFAAMGPAPRLLALTKREIARRRDS
jgi:DNA-directed RNA polymerase specialized sigma24 family protein